MRHVLHNLGINHKQKNVLCLQYEIIYGWVLHPGAQFRWEYVRVDNSDKSFCRKMVNRKNLCHKLLTFIPPKRYCSSIFECQKNIWLPVTTIHTINFILYDYTETRLFEVARRKLRGKPFEKFHFYPLFTPFNRRHRQPADLFSAALQIHALRWLKF